MENKERLSAFDLDALREAFRKFVREQGIPATEWADYAELFLKLATTRPRQSDGDTINDDTRP